MLAFMLVYYINYIFSIPIFFAYASLTPQHYCPIMASAYSMKESILKSEATDAPGAVRSKEILEDFNGQNEIPSGRLETGANEGSVNAGQNPAVLTTHGEPKALIAKSLNRSRSGGRDKIVDPKMHEPNNIPASAKPRSTLKTSIENKTIPKANRDKQPVTSPNQFTNSSPSSKSKKRSIDGEIVNHNQRERQTFFTQKSATSRKSHGQHRITAKPIGTSHNRSTKYTTVYKDSISEFLGQIIEGKKIFSNMCSLDEPVLPLNQIKTVYDLDLFLSALIMREVAFNFLVYPPPTIKPCLWIFLHVRRLTRDLNYLAIALYRDGCATNSECQQAMHVGPRRICCGSHKQPSHCLPMQYVWHTLDWSMDLMNFNSLHLNDEYVF